MMAARKVQDVRKAKPRVFCAETSTQRQQGSTISDLRSVFGLAGTELNHETPTE